MSEPGGVVDAVVDEMEVGLVAMPPTDARRHFHATYLRTTRAIADEARAGGFVDRDWVERWDVAFARLYLDALDAWDAGRTRPRGGSRSAPRASTPRCPRCCTCCSA